MQDPKDVGTIDLFDRSLIGNLRRAFRLTKTEQKYLREKKQQGKIRSYNAIRSERNGNKSSRKTRRRSHAKSNSRPNTP